MMQTDRSRLGWYSHGVTLMFYEAVVEACQSNGRDV